MKAFHSFLRRLPFYALLKRGGHYPDYWYWKLRGKPERIPHLVKQRTVLEYAAKFGLKTLIETGTYYGEMVSAMSTHFDALYSIEQNNALAERAAKEFAGDSRIHIIHGDSKTVLPELLRSLTQPALFWLDAGYYGWEGQSGDRTRLGVELEAILRDSIKGHVVLMDDANGLNGKNGAPTISDLTAYFAKNFPGREVRVANNILRVIPAK